MTIGFTQKHIEELHIENLTTEQFLSIAIETSRTLGWVFSSINDTGFIAHTSNGFFAWNAEIRLKILSGTVTLLSQSRNNEKIEFGKNKANLQVFLAKFYEIKRSLSVEEVIVKNKKEQLHLV